MYNNQAISQRRQRGFNKCWQLALEKQRDTILHRYHKKENKKEKKNWEPVLF